MPEEQTTASPLVPLLERIYATGEVETEHGEKRSAEPVGVPRAHALRLVELLRAESLQSTLETGMAYGLSTLAIAGVHAERGAGQHIAVDPTVHGHFESIGVANLRRAGLEDRVRVIAEGSERALPRLVGEGISLDFAFIDGHHAFDFALLDFFYVDLMLTSGGCVAFHDVWMPSVQDAVAYVLSNRSYEQLPGADAGMVMLRKLGPDTRSWNYHRPFGRGRHAGRPVVEDVRALADELLAGAEQAAAEAGGFRQHDIVLAGTSVRMSFAGEALDSAIFRPFSHASRADAGPPELEIVLWDGGTEPRVPWSAGDVRARGDVRGFEDSGVSAFSEPGSGSVTVFDRERATIAYWVVDARVVPWYERGAPLRSALHQWAAAGGRHFIHGAAVGADGGGVLLAGASGSGKSTIALACLDAGLDYAGDDYVILTGDDAPRAHCVYSTAKLDAEALARLPALSEAVVHFQRGFEHKAVLDLHAYRPDRVRESLPIGAIVLPSISAQLEQPRVRRASPAAALRALAPTTLLQLPGAAQARMTAMASLVRSVPVLALEVGADMAAVPDLVGSICADPAATSYGA